MSNSFSTFLQSVLLEAAIDNRIPSGVLDIGNDDHRMVLAEKLIDRNIDPLLVSEVVNKLTLKDGKYPDRQAFNKEGWLVTFPTPEHRAAAIKKKTHFASDPTHGQGGMNLYYKRKGKQARQKQQDASETDTVQYEQPTQQAPADEQPQDATPAEQNVDQSSPQSGVGTATPKADGSQDQPANDNSGDGESSKLPAAGAEAKPADATQASGDAASTNAQSDKSTSSPAPAKPDTSALVNLTLEFARSKQWTDTPYGDWNDARGQQVAVTALDGQVVPIKFTDREELKDFAQKRMTDGISLREMLRRTDQR